MAIPEERPRPDRRTIVVSANSSWNIVNFRMGLLEGLARKGFRPIVIAPADSYSEAITERGYEFHDLPMSRSGMNPAADALLLLRYYRLIRDCGAAAYLGFTIKPNIYGSIAARLAGAERINNVSGLGTAFLQRAWLERLVSGLYRHAFRGSHTVFFQNSDDRNLFVEKGIVTARQAKLVPGSGVDLDRFRPASDEPGGLPTFLFIGRLLRDKGVREYAEAARLLRSTLPEARFQILGDLDPGNRTGIDRIELQSWIDESGIEYLGHSEDVRPYVAMATAVVLPSYREGMPRVLLEAAAMAKPLVAADVPGSREIVVDGETGLLCTVRDAASLALAMERIAAMPTPVRRAMGEAARTKVQAEFSEALVVDRYLATLLEVAGSDR